MLYLTEKEEVRKKIQPTSIPYILFANNLENERIFPTFPVSRIVGKKVTEIFCQ